MFFPADIRVAPITLPHKIECKLIRTVEEPLLGFVFKLRSSTGARYLGPPVAFSDLPVYARERPRWHTELLRRRTVLQASR